MKVKKEKKRAFFVPLILPEGKFFKICVFSQYIVHWIHFHNIHTFTYQKSLLHTLLLLAFKIAESLQCVLKMVRKCCVIGFKSNYLSKKVNITVYQLTSDPEEWQLEYWNILPLENILVWEYWNILDNVYLIFVVKIFKLI